MNDPGLLQLRKWAGEFETTIPYGARAEFNEVLKSVGLSPALSLSGAEELSDDALNKIEHLCKRRLAGEPLAYLVGSSDFMQKDFKTTASTLIPRPETELLVEACLERLGQGKQLLGCDLGIGSGNITAMLLLSRAQLCMTAYEISSDACKVAASNLRQLDVAGRAKILNKDYLSEDFSDLNPRYDFVAANPPYIPEGDYEALSREVKHEPYKALVGGKKGNEVILGILSLLPHMLKTGGFAAIEIGQGQYSGLKEYIEDSNVLVLSDVIKDHQSIERVIITERIS